MANQMYAMEMKNQLNIISRRSQKLKFLLQIKIYAANRKCLLKPALSSFATLFDSFCRRIMDSVIPALIEKA